MSRVLDRLIARIGGEAQDAPALRAPVTPAASAGDDGEWGGELLEERLVEDEVPRVQPLAPARAEAVPPPTSAKPRAMEQQQPVAPTAQAPAVPVMPLRASAVPAATRSVVPRPSGDADGQSAPARVAPSEQFATTMSGPMRPAPVAPAVQPVPTHERRGLTVAAPQAPPRSATAEPVPTDGFGEDETESLVIEIGRIELIPPAPSAPAPLRRERLVTLSSYLADRREGRR